MTESVTRAQFSPRPGEAHVLLVSVEGVRNGARVQLLEATSDGFWVEVLSGPRAGHTLAVAAHEVEERFSIQVGRAPAKTVSRSEAERLVLNLTFVDPGAVLEGVRCGDVYDLGLVYGSGLRLVVAPAR